MIAVKAKSAAANKLTLVHRTTLKVLAPLAPAQITPIRVASPYKDYAAMSDLDLVTACQQKDERAMTSLLKRYERQILIMIHRSGSDLQDPQDMLQEVNIRIWRSLSNLRNPYAFKGWLKQIVTRLHYDDLRKKINQYQLVSMDEPTNGESEQESTTRDIMDQAPQPETRLLNTELSTKVEEAMALVSEPFRSAAHLRFVDGLSYEQIAVITSSELGTVKSRISRARVKIQQTLDPYLSEAA